MLNRPILFTIIYNIKGNIPVLCTNRHLSFNQAENLHSSKILNCTKYQNILTDNKNETNLFIESIVLIMLSDFTYKYRLS